MKKRFGLHCLVLALTLVLVLLPCLFTEAEAVAPGFVTVGGITVNDGEYLSTTTGKVTTTQPSGGYFHYSAGMLTVASVYKTYSTGIQSQGDLVIKLLTPTNELTVTGGNGIKVTGTLKVTGSGSLTLKTASYTGLSVTGNTEFAQTGDVKVTTSYGTAVSTDGNLTIGGNLTAESAAMGVGIYAKGAIVMNSGTVKASADAAGTYAAINGRSTVTINDGTLDVDSTYHGIIANNLFRMNGGNVTIDTKDGHGIYVENTASNALVYGGVLTINAGRDGIRARGFSAYGGRGYIKSTNTAQDSSYAALKLYADSASYVDLGGNVVAFATTTTSSSSLANPDYSKLSTYDYVYFTGRVYLRGVEVRDGQYLSSTGTSATTGKPTSGGYAHYASNVLTLNGYTGSNSNRNHGIHSDYDLTVRIPSGTTSTVTTTADFPYYYGIHVKGNLTIDGTGHLKLTNGQNAIYVEGSGKLAVENAQLTCTNSGIYSTGAISLENAKVTVNQLSAPYAAGTNALESKSNVTITGGTTRINSPDYADGKFVRGIVGKAITLGGNVDIDTIGMGINATGNVTISSGVVDVYAIYGSGIYTSADIIISGGIVNVKANNDGLYASGLTVTGGQIQSVSTNTSADADNSAVDISINNTTYFRIPDNYAFLAGTTATAVYTTGTVGSLDSYDYVRIGDFVVLHDVELPDGYYLASGNSSNTPTTTMPSGGYAYYNNGVLYLNNYEHTGKTVSVRSFADLQISLTGGNKTGMICGHKGNLRFYGHGTLHIDPAMGSYGIQTPDDVTIAGGRITVEAETGIYCDKFTMSSGMAWVTATYDGLSMNSLDMQGGAITFKSITTANDSTYRAISTRASSPSITIASGLNHMAGNTSAPDILSTIAFTNNDLDFVALGEFVMIRRAIVYKGSYMNSGATEPSQVAGTKGYAYLTGTNTLLLYNYSYSGSDIAIFSNVQLNILLDGTNTLTTTSSGNNATKGIYVRGNLTIENRNSSSDTLNLNTVGTALYSEKNLTIESGTLNLTSKMGNTIHTMGDVTISGGTVNAECTCNSGSATYDVIRAEGNMYMTGGLVELDGAPKSGKGILLPIGNLSVTGGKLYVHADYDSGIVLNKGNLTLQNARVSTSALRYGVLLNQGRLNIASGFLKAVSTETASDAAYCALYLRGTSSDYYNVAPALSQAGDIGSTKDYMEKLTASNLSTLDYVQIGDYIEINGVTVRSGESISPSGAVGTGNKGAGYAYYEVAYGGNKLTLNGYTYNNTASKSRGVGAYTDLTIHVTGSNSSITTGAYNGIEVEGNLTFTGTKKLNVKSNSHAVRTTGNATLSGGDLDLYSHNNCGLYALGNVTQSAGAVTLYSNAGSALQAKAFTINGGSLQSAAWFPGIVVESLTVNGGSVIAKTNNTGSQCAVRANALSCATGMTPMGSANNDGSNLRTITKTDLPSCRYVKISGTPVTTHTVTFKVGTTTVSTKTVNHGSTVTPPADPSQTGYTFLGWYTSGGTKFNFSTAITGNITLTAKFEKNTVSDVLPGDMDNDGDKDTDDAVYLLLNVMFDDINYPITNPDKDMNNDDKINTDDAVYLLLHVMFGAINYPI